MDLYFIQRQQFEVKNVLIIDFIFYKHAAFGRSIGEQVM